MLDILTIAFQTDTTRVASFMFSYEKSGRSYREIEAPGAHHSTSHHQQKPENHAQLAKINAHHISLFSRMLQRMSQIEEGPHSLLDNVMILYGGGISDGNKHNHDDLPILIAGGAAWQTAWRAPFETARKHSHLQSLLGDDGADGGRTRELWR
jgi:hypothetical protein